MSLQDTLRVGLGRWVPAKSVSRPSGKTTMVCPLTVGALPVGHDGIERRRQDLNLHVVRVGFRRLDAKIVELDDARAARFSIDSATRAALLRGWRSRALR